MNAEDEVDVNGTANGSTTEPIIDDINKDNDCGKHFNLAVGGARPKVRHLMCNIPNGLDSNLSEDSAKINNNGEVINPIASTSVVSEAQLCNGANLNCVKSDTFDTDLNFRNNVNHNPTVDKCPLKVRSATNNTANDLSHISNKSNGCSKPEHLVVNERCRADSSSDTENNGDEGLSGDECCIYTYKGDQSADLPNSFFSLEFLSREGDHRDFRDELAGGREEDHRVENNRDGSSSPEMDFLEMDFDPGPSCEQDSDEELNCTGCKEEDSFVEESIGSRSHELLAKPSGSSSFENQNGHSSATSYCRSSTSTSSSESLDEPCPVVPSPSLRPMWVRNVDTRDLWGHHSNSGDLCSPGETVDSEGDLVQWSAGRSLNLHSTLYHCIMAKRLVLDKEASFADTTSLANAPVVLSQTTEDGEIEVRISETGASGGSSTGVSDRTMIWSEQEACAKQVTQISTSACGATAVINVLLALNISFSVDKVKEAVGTRLRAEGASLPEYLFSRSLAGSNHVDLIRGLEVASGRLLYARFFPLYPERDVSLTNWLAYWMRKGAVAIATLNLQSGVSQSSQVPDAWHHQMVFGVGRRGMYLTNPLEFVSEEALWPQLCSPSVLLVRHSDVLARWNQRTSLQPLGRHLDPRWGKMNVLGQVVNMIRPRTCMVTEHISIPASYSSGITLAINREAPAYQELRTTPELPLWRSC
uniref:Uncharacterized protein n=1 Tax=Timema genevievae TaxID=629358 RepID=A0A7R9PPR9_TIMGE|nr:unnamed protein product [Timema genevievae]